MLLRVCTAAMNWKNPIHRSPIHRKWIKALDLVDGEQHGKILHLSSRVHPRNGCFRVAVPNLSLSEVDWDDDNDRVPDEVRKEFPILGEELKASLNTL
jgi:hypothetical protein